MAFRVFASQNEAKSLVNSSWLVVSSEQVVPVQTVVYTSVCAAQDNHLGGIF